MFQCQECGKLFRSVGAAERAVNYGCPQCGGMDIDIHSPKIDKAEEEPKIDSLHPHGVQKCAK